MATLGIATLETGADIMGLQRDLAKGLSLTNNFLDSWRRMWEFTGAIILSRVIQKILDGIRSIGSEVFRALQNFQVLGVRLEGLVARELVLASDGALTFTEALARSGDRAEELFNWIRKIAVETPFTVETLQNTLTMGMAMGLTSEKSQELTLAIGNYTAGMGLSNEVMDRIVYNLGQMLTAGKVTGMELRDLARGALVPISEVLKVMRENLGLTSMELGDFREKASEGAYGVQPFIDAFIEFAEVQFPGAMDRMAGTWQTLVSNVHDFIQVGLGVSIFGPLFDKISEKGAKIFENMLSPEMQAKMIALGDALSALFDFEDLDITGIVDKVEGFIDRLTDAFVALRVAGFEKFLEELGLSQGSIDLILGIREAFRLLKEKVEEMGEYFNDTILPILEEVWTWLKDNWKPLLLSLIVLFVGFQLIALIPTIAAFFSLLAAMWPVYLVLIALAVAAFFIYKYWDELKVWFLETWDKLLVAWKNFKDKVSSGWEKLMEAIEPVLLILKVIWDAIVNSLQPVFEKLWATLKNAWIELQPSLQALWEQLKEIWESLKVIWELFKPGIIATLITFAVVFIGIFLGAIVLIAMFFTALVEGIVNFIQGVVAFIQPILDGISTMLQGVKMFFWGIGEFIYSLFNLDLAGMLNGIAMMIGGIITYVAGMIQTVINTLLAFLVGIGGFIYGYWKGLIDFLKNLFKGLWEALEQKVGNIEDKFKTVIEHIKAWFKDAFDSVVSWIEDIIEILGKLVKAIASLIIPDFLEEHSPSPLEHALSQSGKEMMDMSRNSIPSLSDAFEDLNFTEETIGALDQSSSYNSNMTFNFRDTTLDEDQLRLIELRREVLYA